MASAKIFRINYKSDFILTLVSDAGWMTPFCIKFWTGSPMLAYYASWDGETYTHCAPVAGEPTKLLVQFDDHHLPIGDLKFQIAYHFTVADFPNDTEDEVLNQANITTEVDGVAYDAVMLDFNGETAPEIQFSLPAYANEAQRIANEEQRIANEEQRIANEEARIAAETVRQQNEAQRIQQESARVTEFARLKRESEQATADANAAATLANQKAQLAADKAALADAAATLANAKAQLAADKAALANAAAQLANEKAALAQQKAEYAQTQGGYAKDQGDYAKDQGDYAKAQGDTALADHQRAEADHGIAVDDNTQAGNDHTRAEADHGIAVDDHTQAGNDHTRAEADHGIAADDHTQAGNDHTRAESDHGIAADDHTQAGNDHTRAESDHTRAESDHAAVEVYVDSLGAFDISAYHATGGVLAKYADLTAALGTNGANIPDALRKGGMSVKFVLSSDNKYVQYRYMETDAATAATFTNVDNWQGVDAKPVSGSRNLTESRATFEVESSLNQVNGLVNKVYNFKCIKVTTSAGTSGRIRCLFSNIGYKEPFKFKVLAEDGAVLKENAITIYIVSSNDSTYALKNDLSVNEEFVYSTAAYGYKGFAVQVSSSNVTSSGTLTLVIERLRGNIYDILDQKTSYYLNFASAKMPSITLANKVATVVMQATSMVLKSYNKTGGNTYSYTFVEDTTFTINHDNGLYWDIYNNTVEVAAITSQIAGSANVICLLSNSNGVLYGFLANNYLYIRNIEYANGITALTTQVNGIAGSVDAIEQELSSFDVPDYFLSNVEQAEAKVIANMAAVGRNGESFIFISDMHWDTNVKNSPKLVRKILNSTNLIDVLSTGDLINESKDKSVMATALIDCVKAFSFNGHPLITTRGNHDDNSNWSSQADVTAYAFTFNEYYSYFIKQMEGMVTFIGTNDSFYYDKPETKTRYIFLDSARNGTVDGGSRAIPNAVNLLKGTETGWKVIFIQHFPTGAGMNAIKAMVDGCNDRDNAKVIPGYSITADFSNAKCECIAIFAGHTHADGSSTTDGGVPIIIIDTDCLGRKTASEQEEWRGTYNEQCFDVVTMDYVNKIIKCVRVGRGSDRTFTY